MPSTPKRDITWDEVWLAANDIAEDCNIKGLNIDLVIGIHNGGAIPAAMVSRALVENPHQKSWPMVACIKAESYKGGVQADQVRLTMPFALETHFLTLNEGANVLIVDEILDSGKTMDEVEGFLARAFVRTRNINLHRAAMWAKHPALAIHGEHIKDDGWLVFPWENANANVDE